MAILVIWASPNQDGLTAAAKNEIVSGINATGKTSEVLHLNKQNIKSCLACGDGWGTCRANGSCIIKDNFADIYQKVISAEAIVWITPVYWHDLAENLKAFLDRMRRCETGHAYRLQGKKCLLVACAGGSGYGAVQCLHNLEETLGHMRMTAVDRLPVTQFNKVYMLPALNMAGQYFAENLNNENP